MAKNIKEYNDYISSTMVEHLPNRPKVNGLSLATVAGTVVRKCQNVFLSTWHAEKAQWWNACLIVLRLRV